MRKGIGTQGMENGMNVEFFWVGKSTYLFKIDDELKLAFNPVLEPENRVYSAIYGHGSNQKGPKYNIFTFRHVDMWFLTNGDESHLDPYGRNVIAEDSFIVAEPAVLRLLNDKDYSNLNCLNDNSSITCKKKDYIITVNACKAYQGNNIFLKKIMGDLSGYQIKIQKGEEQKVIFFTEKRIYRKNYYQMFLTSQFDYAIAPILEYPKEKFHNILTSLADLFLQKGKEVANYTKKRRVLDNARATSFEKGGWNDLDQLRQQVVSPRFQKKAM